jgi:hypothetical protein
MPLFFIKVIFTINQSSFKYILSGRLDLCCEILVQLDQIFSSTRHIRCPHPTDILDFSRPRLCDTEYEPSQLIL